jgi:Flp pilus assembly protein TadD
MKILLLGNHQARALAAAWCAMRPGDDVAVHELETLNGDAPTRSRVSRQIQLADIIVHHPLGNDVAAGRTAALLQDSKAVRVCVPMIRFTGLQPDIVMLGPSQDRFPGPMGAYHSRIALTEFLSGHSEGDALASFESAERYGRLGYFGEFDRSAAELASRDALCHVPGTPILMKYVHDRPTLYTVDHPTNVIFKDLVTATLDQLGLDHGDVDPEYLPVTHAGGVVWPPSPLIHAHHGLRFPPARFIQAGSGARRLLSIEDFVWESYECYREGKEKLLRTTVVQTILADIGLAGRSDPEIGPPTLTSDRGGPTGRRRLRRTLGDLASVLERTERDRSFAQEVANEALWALPADGQGLLYLSQILEKLGNNAAAIDVLRGCISQPDETPTLRSACAERLLELGANEALGEEIAALNAQKGVNQEALDVVVNYARRLGKTGLALNAALKMIRTAPDRATPYLMMAHIAMDAKQAGLAIASIEKALEFEPRNAHHFALRGLALESLGCRPAAISDYEVAVSIEPDYPAFRQQLERLREMS